MGSWTDEESVSFVTAGDEVLENAFLFSRYRCFVTPRVLQRIVWSFRGLDKLGEKVKVLS